MPLPINFNQPGPRPHANQDAAQPAAAHAANTAQANAPTTNPGHFRRLSQRPHRMPNAQAAQPQALNANAAAPAGMPLTDRELIAQWHE